MGDRFKRILAFLIDWNITLFPFVILFACMTAFSQQQSSVNPVVGLLCFLCVISAFALIVLRDVVFKGRSLGKRIFGLYVYDKNILQPASTKQRVLRSIFFFLLYIDGIMLLATGRSIGDRAAGTLVLSQASLDEFRANRSASEDGMYARTAPVKKNPRTLIRVVAIVLCCMIAFIGLIQIILNAQKDTEEYQLAYNYLITSDAFKQLNADVSQIRMNQYSSKTYSPLNGDPVTQTVTIGFLVDFRSFQVICHKENGVWQVCDECTSFD